MPPESGERTGKEPGPPTEKLAEGGEGGFWFTFSGRGNVRAGEGKERGVDTDVLGFPTNYRECGGPLPSYLLRHGFRTKMEK